MAAIARIPPHHLLRQFDALSVRGHVLDHLRANVDVKTLTGKTTPVICWQHSYVSDVKEAIRVAEKIPTDQQRLVFGGRILEDRDRLLQYDIGDGCTLHLVLKLRGGARFKQTGKNGCLSFCCFRGEQKMHV